MGFFGASVVFVANSILILILVRTLSLSGCLSSALSLLSCLALLLRLLALLLLLLLPLSHRMPKKVHAAVGIRFPLLLSRAHSAVLWFSIDLCPCRHTDRARKRKREHAYASLAARHRLIVLLLLL